MDVTKKTITKITITPEELLQKIGIKDNKDKDLTIHDFYVDKNNKQTIKIEIKDNENTNDNRRK